VIVKLHSSQDVVLNGHRWKWVGALENHAYLATNQKRVNIWGIKVLAINLYFTFNPCPWNNFVHTVKGAQESGFTTPGRTNESSDSARLNRQGDVFDGFELAVVDVEVFYFNAFGHNIPLV
jgi:hypothetical protein